MMLYLALITMSVFVMSVIYSMQKKFEREEIIDLHLAVMRKWGEE